MTISSSKRHELRKLRHVRKTKFPILHHPRILKQKHSTWKRIVRVVRTSSLAQYPVSVSNNFISSIQLSQIIKSDTKSKKAPYVRVSQNFKKLHTTVQKFKLFYGHLKHHQFQQILQKSGLSYRSRLRRHCAPNSFAEKRRLIGATSRISRLEARLVVALWRSFLVTRISSARQLICHGYITVNGIVITSPSYSLKEGDFVKVEAPFLLDKLKFEMHRSAIWSLLLFRTPPPHLEVRLNSFGFIFCYIPIRSEVSFPTPIRIGDLQSYYTKA